MNGLGLDINLPERRGKTRNSWLGVLGACAIVWYFLGIVALLMSLNMNADMAKSLYNAEQIAYVINTPAWAKFFNSISLCAGLIGSGYILLRKADAYKWYMLSLISILIVMLDALTRGGFDTMPSTHFGVSIIGIIIGVYLFWASYNARNKGELRTR